jgi:hypothetical protein
VSGIGGARHELVLPGFPEYRRFECHALPTGTRITMQGQVHATLYVVMYASAPLLARGRGATSFGALLRHYTSSTLTQRLTHLASSR